MDNLRQKGIPDLEALISNLMSVNNLLPNEDQAIPFRVSPDKPAREAIDEMKKHGLDQIPVVSSSEEVLGVFSFRVFAEKAVRMPNGTPLGDLPVDEFLERPFYIPVEENISSVLDLLLSKGYLLVESPKNYLGTLTPLQATKGLHDIAQAFMALQHIELLLRAVITACVPPTDLVTVIESALGKYKDFEDMVFSEYEKIISNNWSFFEAVFGPNSRDRTLTKLKEVREIRNATFHFKYELTADKRTALVTHRDWLVRRAKQYYALHGGSSNER